MIYNFAHLFIGALLRLLFGMRASGTGKHSGCRGSHYCLQSSQLLGSAGDRLQSSRAPAGPFHGQRGNCLKFRGSAP